MIKNLLHTFLFILSVVVSYGMLLVTVALGKEGVGIEDIWRLIFITATLVFIVIVWILISRITLSSYVKALSYTCIAIIIFPLIILILLDVYIIKTDLQGKYYSNKAVISHYQESLIKWPGFLYPVGIQMIIEMPTPFAVNAKRYAGFYPPVIWMGPAVESISRKILFFTSFDWALQISDKLPTYAFLKGVVFNKIKQPQSNIVQDGQSKIIFNLYPSAIEYLESENAFCTYAERSNDIYANRLAADNYASGSQLNAMWFYAGKNDVDLSNILTNALQQASQLANNPMLWINMHKQFEDNNLINIGYHQCVIQSRTHCFCR